LGEFNGMSSQSHVSNCRVLPLGELTVTILEPHATLQGVRIPSAILKIVFSPYFIFLFLMQFRLWRAAAFVSSPIHLLLWGYACRVTHVVHIHRTLVEKKKTKYNAILLYECEWWQSGLLAIQAFFLNFNPRDIYYWGYKNNNRTGKPLFLFQRISVLLFWFNLCTQQFWVGTWSISLSILS